MEDPITWETLGTVAGASGAALIVIAFLRLFFNIKPAVAKGLAALIAVALLVMAVVVGSAGGWREWVLGVLSGLAAGVAAASTLETVALSGPPSPPGGGGLRGSAVSSVDEGVALGVPATHVAEIGEARPLQRTGFRARLRYRG